MFQYLTNFSVVRGIARRVLPFRVRQKIAAHVVQPPTVDHFRILLSETSEMEAVPGRIVMACGSLQPGGAERQVANTLIGLAESPAIESLHLLCDFLHGGTQEQYDFYLPLARKSGATIRESGKWSWRGEQPRLPSGLRKVMANLHPGLVSDVVSLYREFRLLRPEVVHSWLDWCNVRAGLAAVLAGVPRILLSGRNLSPRHFALNTDYFFPAYAALSERDQDQVVFLNNSQAGANDYAAWLSLPVNRIRVIRNGIQFSDDARPSPEHIAAFRAKLGIPIRAPVIGGMFRFNEEKRPLLWLFAAGRIAQALPDAHFVIFGQGNMRTEMEKTISELGIASCTHLCDVLEPSLNGLAPCDLILLTSRGEGTPNVLLEAQWLGLPVVAVDAGGVAEAVNEGVTGTVVRSNDAIDIASAVLNILTDDNFRLTASKEGPAFIAARYGMERMITETIAAYDLEADVRTSA